MSTYRLKEGSPQAQFQASRAPIQIFGGAFANGKTTALCIKGLLLSSVYPGSEGLLARETYPKLNDTLRKVFLKWAPKHWVKKYPTQDDNTVYFKNGSSVAFRYIAQRGKQSEDGTTTSNLLSSAYDWIGVDQLEDPGIVYKDFLDLAGRCRGQTPYKPRDEEDITMPDSGPRWMMLTLNPTHNWPYKQLVRPLKHFQQTGVRLDDLIYDHDTGRPMIELFEGSTYTNKENLAKDYLKMLEATYKGQMRDRYLLGLWVAFEGLVYDTFSRERNVLTRDQMLDHLRECKNAGVQIQVIEGYDFGLVKPTCYLLGFVDHLGRVFILDGFHKANFVYSNHAKEIREIRARYEGLLPIAKHIIADPAIFRRQVVNGHKVASTSLSTIFNSKYKLNMVPGANDVTSGIAKVSSYLNGLPTIQPLRGEGPGPLLYIAAELDFVFDEFESYFWKKNPQGDTIDEPMEGNDHSLDTIKYMLSKLPEASQIRAPVELRSHPMFKWHTMDTEDYRRRQLASQ